MVSARTRQKRTARRRRKRRAAIAATVRSMGQLVVVLAGGTLAGGLLVLAAFPDATDPVPSAICVAGAGAVALLAVWGARRLRPVA